MNSNTTKMQALVKQGLEVGLQELPLPVIGPDDVLIQIQMAGLCRTDLMVLQGLIPTIDPMIPGHEFSGLIVACGSAVDRKIGEAVTVNPMIGCSHCPSCLRQEPEHCNDLKVLGIDRPGAFAEYIAVPAHACYCVQNLSWKKAAYTEPLAAALGIFKADLSPQQLGWVSGQNRIAELTRRLLQYKGFNSISAEASEIPDRSLDYVIESGLSPELLKEILRMLKPGGQLILKSRHLPAFALPWSQITRQEIRIQGYYYGRFEEAIALLLEDTLPLEDLLGTSYPLQAYQSFINARDEQAKIFLELQPCVASLRL